MRENSDVDSLVDWWREAGVDTIVADEPGSWLREPKKAPAKGSAPQPNLGRPPFDPGPMPQELAEFRRWLLDVTSQGTADRPIDAAGDPSAGLMILVDMPDIEDIEAGQLMAGEIGLLFDRMMAAIGRDRASLYIAAISPARPVGGTIDDAKHDLLTEAARHHVGLAAPKALLCLGEAPSRAFCEAGLSEARGSQHNFNHDGGTVSVVATFHPRFLLRQPRFKAQSWKDLQMLIEGMNA